MTNSEPERSEPPRRAEALLRLILPDHEKGALLGDLREEYGRWIEPSLGRRRAAFWYWSQVLASVGPTLARRWRRRRAGRRPRAPGAGQGRPPHVPQWEETTTMGRALDTLRLEIRHAWRALRARPLHATLSALTLALGIGGTAAVAAIAEEMLMRPLPYADEGELVAFWDPFSWSAAEFTHLRGDFDGFTGVAAWRGEEATFRLGDGPARVASTVLASAEIFGVLGVAPQRGRLFQMGDDRPGAEPVVVVSQGFSVRELGGVEEAVGRRITLDGAPRTIIAVMPPGFYFPDPSVELWLPLELRPDDRAGMLALVGRVAGQRDPTSLSPELTRMTERLEAQFDYGNPSWGHTSGAAVTPLRDELHGDMGSSLFLVGGAMLLILVVASVNVAALGVARTSSRIPEMAVRSALGAGRVRMARQLILEALSVAVLGAVIGAALAAGGFSYLSSVLPLSIGAAPTLDLRLFAFSFVIAVAVGIGVGIVPATSVLRGRIGGLLATVRGSHRAGRGRLASGLVVVEVGLTVLLVIGAGLLLRSVRALDAIDPGFEVDGLVTVDIVMGSGELDLEARGRTLDALAERIGHLAGVDGAAATQKLPLGGSGWTTGFQVEGVADDGLFSAFRSVTAGYFETMGIRLVEGRSTAPTDLPGSEPVVVVNESLAREIWPGQAAVGRRVTSGFTGEWATVIGVVEDVRDYGLTDEGVGTRYQLYRQAGIIPEANTLVVRTDARAGAIVEPILSAIHEVDPGIAIARVASMEARAREAMGRVGDVVVVLGLLGTLALVLGAVGVYGVTAHYVGCRTREWGVRLALGQAPRRVFRLILWRGLRLVIAGVLLGVTLSVPGTRALEAILYQVGPRDPLAFGGAAAILVSAGLVAALVPALRASRTDPSISLQAE